MNLTDPIADMLTRIRNAAKARKKEVSLPSSRIKVEIAKILKEEGFIRNYKVVEDKVQGEPEPHPEVHRGQPGRHLRASPDQHARLPDLLHEGLGPEGPGRAGARHRHDLPGPHVGEEVRGDRASAARSSARSGRNLNAREIKCRRVGKKPVKLPPGVKVVPYPDRIEFEGKKGKLTTPLYPGIEAAVEGETLVLKRADDSQDQRTLHGLCRSLAQNAVTGVSEGYSRQLEIVGVGYKAKVDKNRLELSLGYAKPVVYDIPEGIEIVAEKPTLITVRGIDKQRVGQMAYEIKSFRKPDPYKQKGVRYVGEKLIKKERKAGVTGA